MFRATPLPAPFIRVRTLPGRLRKFARVKVSSERRYQARHQQLGERLYQYIGADSTACPWFKKSGSLVFRCRLQQSFSPPNVGCVGPQVDKLLYLEYDFVHRTHWDILGFHV